MIHNNRNSDCIVKKGTGMIEPVPLSETYAYYSSSFRTTGFAGTYVEIACL